ncbi:MAG: hypothetical protein EXQ55_09160 [Acidobacteria bacterium]|nr:hypothetical protein [Acidobacteriota bacterium]
MVNASGRPLRWLFALELAGGLLAIFILKPPIYRDAHAIGMHAVSLLVPYVAAVGFAVMAASVAASARRGFDRRDARPAALSQPVLRAAVAVSGGEQGRVDPADGGLSG